MVACGKFLVTLLAGKLGVARAIFGLQLGDPGAALTDRSVADGALTFIGNPFLRTGLRIFAHSIKRTEGGAEHAAKLSVLGFEAIDLTIDDGVALGQFEM